MKTEITNGGLMRIEWEPGNELLLAPDGKQHALLCEKCAKILWVPLNVVSLTCEPCGAEANADAEDEPHTKRTSRSPRIQHLEDLKEQGYQAGLAGLPCDAPTTRELERAAWEIGYRVGKATFHVWNKEIQKVPTNEN